jgi:hypothetical protein
MIKKDEIIENELNFHYLPSLSRRFFARLIDFIFLNFLFSFIFLLLQLLFIFNRLKKKDFFIFQYFLLIFLVFFLFYYFVFFPFIWKENCTIGKKLLNIKIFEKDNKKINNLSKILEREFYLSLPIILFSFFLQFLFLISNESNEILFLKFKNWIKIFVFLIFIWYLFIFFQAKTNKNGQLNCDQKNSIFIIFNSSYFEKLKKKKKIQNKNFFLSNKDDDNEFFDNKD